MKPIQLIFIVFLLISCAEEKGPDMGFLEGTWKMENKEQYEVWEKTESNDLNGYSYRIKDGQKRITETLLITKVNDQFIYQATVPDQNEGKSVQFVLNTKIDSLYSFENGEHDFPKKIQYKLISENRLEVTVLGENNEGFSFIQIKQ